MPFHFSRKARRASVRIDRVSQFTIAKGTVILCALIFGVRERWSMARSKFKSEKRQKELARQKKKADKLKRRLDKKNEKPSDTPEPSEAEGASYPGI